jgi:hypothetical protein
MIPFLPPSGEQLAADNITLSDDQNVALERSIDWLTLNGGYNTEQSTKVGFNPFLNVVNFF